MSITRSSILLGKRDGNLLGYFDDEKNCVNFLYEFIMILSYEVRSNEFYLSLEFYVI